MPNGDDDSGVEQLEQGGGPTAVLPPQPLMSGMAEGVAQASTDSLGGAPQPTNADGSNKPVFFQKVLAGLGMGLVDAVRAGLQTPLGPNQFGQAATAAQQMPFQRQLQAEQQKTALLQQKAQQQQLQDFPTMEKVRMAQMQVDLQTSQALLRNMDEEHQYGMTNDAVKWAEKMMEGGNLEVIPGTGLSDNINDAQQAAATAHATDKQGINTLVLPVTGKNGKYQYAAVRFTPKGTLTEEIPPETLHDFDDLGVPPKQIRGFPVGSNAQQAGQFIAKEYKLYIAAGNAAKAQRVAETREAGANLRAQLTDKRQRLATAVNAGLRSDANGTKLWDNANKAIDNVAKLQEQLGVGGMLLDQITDGRKKAAVQRASDIAEQEVKKAESYQKPAAKQGGNEAPEGTVVNMADGSKQIKKGGKWVPLQQ